MRWQRLTTYAGLLLGWAALAVWQHGEYVHEYESARRTLRRQVDSLMNALVGGIRSHRRLGRFLQEQLQGTLDELVKSEDILAVAVTREDGRRILSAGNTDLLRASPPMASNESWEPTGLRMVRKFQLTPSPRGPPGMSPGVFPGRGQPGGISPGGRRPPGNAPEGGPFGPGRGWGRQLAWPGNGGDAESPFSMGGRFAAVLVLDRSQVDAQCRRAAWSRTSVVAAGGLVLIFLALAWRASVRLAEAHGRAGVLEAETRHLRDLSQAAAGLAHETRNPLGLIRGWTQRLARPGSDVAEHRQQARAIVEECDRVTARINQFLAFARPCEPKIEAVNAAEVVDELAALLEPDLDAKDLTLNRALLKPDETIQANREMLRQVLFNMVQNAVQFAPEGGDVEISVRCGQDGMKRLEVADRGQGVALETVESLFTPYFTTRPDGTGLGLAIVRRIATAHGWEAGYTARPGGGSIFYLDRIHG